METASELRQKTISHVPKVHAPSTRPLVQVESLADDVIDKAHTKVIGGVLAYEDKLKTVTQLMPICSKKYRLVLDLTSAL